MDYIIFTYPNCDKCETFKDFLKRTPLVGQELSLAQKEGKMKFREFLHLLRRDEKEAIIIPVFVLRDEGEVLGVFQDHVELDRWLKSKV